MMLSDIINFDRLNSMYQFGRKLNLTDFAALYQAAKSRRYKAGEFLIQEGSSNNEVFFLLKGIIRVFNINAKGEEITIDLFAEYQVFASYDVVYFERPSRFYAQALEDTHTLSIKHDVLQTLLEKNTKLNENRKFILHKLLKTSFNRIESLVLLSPEERYLQFLEENSHLFNRVPNKYIANMLGITPVSLSRIKKRVLAKKRGRKS